MLIGELTPILKFALPSSFKFERPSRWLATVVLPHVKLALTFFQASWNVYAFLPHLASYRLIDFSCCWFFWGRSAVAGPSVLFHFLAELPKKSDGFRFSSGWGQAGSNVTFAEPVTAT